MPNFNIQKITAVNGKQDFYQLEIDNVCVLDAFELELEQIYQGELAKIFYLMQAVANNQSLPPKKYKLLDRLKNDNIKDFEFKTKHIRIYGFQASNGKIIAVAGFKNSQPRDISRLRSLKYQYFEKIK